MQAIVSSERNGIRTYYGPFNSIKEAAAFRNEILDPRTDTKTVNQFHVLFTPEQAPRDPRESLNSELRRMRG